MRKIKLMLNNFVPKSLLAFLLISVLVISFQNCSQTDVHHLQIPILNLKSQGNGEPYDGKPNYTRLVPGLTCENKDIAIGELDIHGALTTVVTNENSCQHISDEVPTAQLERSSFTSKYIGFGGGVYTYLEDRNENIKKGIFTEAWCRAMNADRSASLLEFGVEWQQQGQIANLSIMSQKNPVSQIRVATRLIEFDRVGYTLPGFEAGELYIYFNQKLSGQKVAGFFNGKLDGSSKAQRVNVECLMGGQFDSVAPQFDYPGSANKTLAQRQAITGLTPTINKSSATFLLDKALPSGLSFNENSGAISGSPVSLMNRQKYLVTAVFPFGQITRQISIAVASTQVVDQALSSVNSVACADPSSNCDLHGAIQLANHIAPFALIIQIKSSKIDLNGEMNLRGDVSIQGLLDSRSVIDAKSLSRHLNVNEIGNLELIHVSLINGKESEGGSIYSKGAGLQIKDVSFSGNVADDGKGYGRGGAIFATSGNIEILNSDFTNNQTPVGGHNAGGGAIFLQNPQSFLVKDSSFTQNKGMDGGAIYFNGNMYSSIFNIPNRADNFLSKIFKWKVVAGFIEF